MKTLYKNKLAFNNRRYNKLYRSASEKIDIMDIVQYIQENSDEIQRYISRYFFEIIDEEIEDYLNFLNYPPKSHMSDRYAEDIESICLSHHKYDIIDEIGPYIIKKISPELDEQEAIDAYNKLSESNRYRIICDNIQEIIYIIILYTLDAYI